MGIGLAPSSNVGRRRARDGGRAPETGLRAEFEERGYVAPVPIFGRRECRKILGRLGRAESRPPLDWDKSRAVTSVDFHALATHDRILELVTELIGDDVLLWGASLVVKWPGRTHPWHTDIESAMPEGETVSVWIGLTGTNERSALRVVPHSHRFGVTLQQVRQERGAGRTGVTDADVAGWARELDVRSDVLPLDMANGDALLFDGRLWHGSCAMQWYGRRCAVLLQYATPRTAIRIPNLDRLEWPFESYDYPQPPCIVVRGHDADGVNRLVPGPAAADDPKLPGLSTRIHPARPQTLFRGATPTLRSVRCEVSVAGPSDPLHRNEHAEELLLVLDGEATLEVDGTVHPAPRGTLAYFPSGVAHVVRSGTCMTFTWAADGADDDDVLPFCLVPPAAVLHGQTKYLRDLTARFVTLQPGAGDESRVDSHDVAIVVLEGTVESRGRRIDPHGVAFHAAGEPHGIQNAGAEPATCVVLELHGRRLKGYGAHARPAHSLARLRRDRHRMGSAAASAARSAGRSIRRRLRVG